MARTNIPLSTFNANDDLTDPAGTAADETNGHVVAPVASWPGVTLEDIVLRVVLDTAGDAATVTVKAGANPPALEAGQGDLAVLCADNAATWIGPFRSGRFQQVATDADAEGFWLDIDDETGVTITAFALPRVA